MTCCGRCGAVVLDEEMHTRHHDITDGVGVIAWWDAVEYLPVRAYVVDGRVVRIEVER